MKACLLLLLLSLWVPRHLAAQNNPFTGTGKSVTTTYPFTNFNKLAFYDLDGEVEIEVGKPYSIETRIKDYYVPILAVQQQNDQVNITFQYTQENNKYISKPDIKVIIRCPTLLTVYHRGNSTILVSGIKDSLFTMTTEGNGPSVLQGQVDKAVLSKDGNGGMTANELVANSVTATSVGNGNLVVNASQEVVARRNGNGAIMQRGKGRVLVVPGPPPADAQK